MAQDIGAFPNLQMLARALGGEVSNGQVLAPGPGHSPKDRSLSVKLDTKAPDGFVVHSFSIDDPIACRDFVREKLNLPAFKLNGRRRVSDDTVERALMAAVGVQSQTQKPKGKLSAQYDYQNADGTLLYQVLRYDDPKDFRQRRPNGNGGWIWKLDDRRVVYRWLELLKYPDATVFITEGEKDADRVAELNLCATTVAAGKWTEDCIKALADRDVVIFQDNDDAGRKKALNAAQALRDTAKTIRIVALPDLPDGGDVSDWLDRTGLSGSTAWNASVRSRLYLERAKTEKDEEPDPDLRVLEVVKSNYGPVGERINLRWKDGLFLPVGGMNNLERAAAEQAAEQLFLTLLDEFNRQGRHTSAKPNAPTYAPTLFAKEKQARQRGIRKADLETAMRNLFATGKVCLEQYGPPSRATSKLVRK
jgi:Toprim-like